MSFLSDFRELGKGTEANPNYVIFSGLVALSAIVSRRVWLPMGHYDIFPNLYVVLVGPPGMRKTTAMDLAKGLIRELNKKKAKVASDPLLGDLTQSDYPISAECVSKEKLIQDMRATERKLTGLAEKDKDNELYSPMTVMATELSEFLMVGGQGMISFLTTIYDRSVYDYRTKNKGQEYVNGPYLNVIACTTPDWITMYLKDDIISGGFSRRALFIYETEEGPRIAIPKKTPEMLAAFKSMVDYADRVTQIKGPMVLTTDAEAFYVNWYENHRIPADPNVAGYYRSKHVQMFKLAMLISLSESPQLIITLDHVKFAFDLLSLMEQRLSAVFAGMGRNELHAVAHKAVELLQTVPPKKAKIDGVEKDVKMMPEKVFKAEMWRNTGKLGVDEILQHLVETDKIQKLAIKDSNGLDRVYIVLKS